ncbi:MAG TPA: hypothetical protein VHF89_17850 [Solirubrobacteraceae bacterium]|nr:hypothetical protein [Solirubrobacteraceae bacterium]
MTNNSNASIGFVGGNEIIPSGGNWKSGNLGDIAFDLPYRGVLSFHDIADQHIPGDSGETWGVLIAYQGEEYVGRYEGGGQLQVTINAYYQAILSGMDLRQVYLPAMEIAGQATAAEGAAPAEPEPEEPADAPPTS